MADNIEDEEEELSEAEQLEQTARDLRQRITILGILALFCAFYAGTIVGKMAMLPAFEELSRRTTVLEKKFFNETK